MQFFCIIPNNNEHCIPAIGFALKNILFTSRTDSLEETYLRSPSSQDNLSHDKPEGQPDSDLDR